MLTAIISGWWNYEWNFFFFYFFLFWYAFFVLFLNISNDFVVVLESGIKTIFFSYIKI